MVSKKKKKTAVLPPGPYNGTWPLQQPNKLTKRVLNLWGNTKTVRRWQNKKKKERSVELLHDP